MPILQVPKTFFKKERQQLYANWPVAFWRELTQNATDAGALTITIVMERRDGYVNVQFHDDGPGISRAVMEEVYFRLGETTKGGPLDILKLGGFGRARILTCFSMQQYSIRTQNLIVRGEGADYSIEEVAETIRGCHLSIEIDDAPLNEMEMALRLFLRQSQLGCHVIVNGEPWTQWALRGALVTKLARNEIPFASVHVQSVGLLNHVIIRSKGLQTFFQISRVPKQVIIEIEPHLLCNVLTGNRDGMLHDYSTVVDEFLESITLNSSILTPQRMRDAPLMTAEAAFTSVYGRPSELASDMQTIYVFNDLDDQGIARKIETFLPSKWNAAKQRIFRVWQIACQLAVDAMIETTGMESLDWSVGWYFGESTKHAVTKRKAGLYIFCLNPLDLDGEFRYDNSINDHRRLLAMAKHEVCHARFFSHDEDFATLLTELDMKVDPTVFFDSVEQALNPNTPSKRAKRLMKAFSEGHMKVLMMFEEHAAEHNGVLSRDQVTDLWLDPWEGSQHPAHARLAELAGDTEFGEHIVIADGKATSKAGVRSSLYRLTEAGRKRFRQQVSLEPPKVLPPLSLVEEMLLQSILYQSDPDGRPMKKSDAKVYEGIFRAGSAGISIRDLAYSDYGRTSGMSYHQMTRGQNAVLHRQGLIKEIGRTERGAGIWAAIARLSETK